MKTIKLSLSFYFKFKLREYDTVMFMQFFLSHALNMLTMMTSIVQSKAIDPLRPTNAKMLNANPVFLGGLFPNGKYFGMWLPVLNR